VALCAEPAAFSAGVRADLLGAFDVVLEAGDELVSIAETVQRWPIASMSVAQLLRHNEGLSAHEGLVAESLVYSTLQAGPEFEAWLAAHRPKGAPVHAEPAIVVGRWDDCLELTLNRPEKRNAFSVAMRDALVEALRVALADESIRQIVIRGEGPAFSSGGDLDEFGQHPDPATAHAVRSTRHPGRLLAQLADRLRFEIHGDCIGAGVELPAFAGHVTAVADTSFQLPEVGLGLVPGAGGTVSLPRRIGRQRTAYLALSRTRLDLDTALAWGLVDERRE